MCYSLQYFSHRFKAVTARFPTQFPLVFKPMGNAYTDGPILSARWFNKVFLTMRI